MDVDRAARGEIPGHGLKNRINKLLEGSRNDPTFHSFISRMTPLVILLNAQPCGRFTCWTASHHA
jgi:hypothetical protein